MPRSSGASRFWSREQTPQGLACDLADLALGLGFESLDLCLAAGEKKRWYPTGVALKGSLMFSPKILHAGSYLVLVHSLSKLTWRPFLLWAIILTFGPI